jgi:hypothetical protein
MDPQHEERRLITILAADVVGYSRLMAADESGTFARQPRSPTLYGRARNFILNVDRKYWLLGISAGLAVGFLGMLVALLNVDPWFQFASYFAGPALFGAVFVYCLRSTTGTNWWRGLCLLLGIVAAHFGAFYLAVMSYGSSDVIPPFIYGATFALVVAALAALLFPSARSAWLVAVTVLASGFVALSYLPLEDIVPWRGFFVSETATWLTIGLVYALVAALLGLRLFEKKTVVNG